MLVGHLGTAVLLLALQAWYIYAIVKNPTFDQSGKIIWVMIIFQFNLLAMPVYWYRYVWHEAPARPPQPVTP
ncbi:MAG: hypothetical protein M3Q65_17610 [Chloroflexota bacterium]|nr:hypothetical protein [Chloroflexota bacterium]